MGYVLEGFRQGMHVAANTAALATSIVMLIASVELVPQGYLLSFVIFGSGSCVLLWHSAKRVWAMIRPEVKEKVTP